MFERKVKITRPTNLWIKWLVALAWTLCSVVALGADEGLTAWWKFDEDRGRIAFDSISGVNDTINGNFKYVEGVTGNAIRFDGYSTCVIRKAADAPRLTDSFAIEAWVALQTYPWNWTAIASQEKDHNAGYFFGIGAEGHVGLHLSLDGQWRQCTSPSKLPLLKWSHVAGTFHKNKGINIYISGKPAGSLLAKGLITPAESQDLLLGTSHTRMCPANTEREPSRRLLSNMILDGLIDEVKVYGRALTGEQISESFAAITPKKKQPLAWRVMPSGPEGAGSFGGFYTNLKYCDEWDVLWRGKGPDVVVRFDLAPIRLVSWRGISYNPCWVTENGNWFSNEFMERGTAMGCGESMSDKHARYSHIKIIESNNARTVLYWRYAPVDILYQHPNSTSRTDWGDWAEEYWTVYPDGVAARKVVMWTSNLKAWHEWCQSLPIFQPGQRPEDVLDANAFLSLAHMAGQSCTYRWPPEKPEVPGANIQVVNYKSRFKPFLILTNKNPRIWFARIRRRRPGEEVRGMSMSLSSSFWWWNHWPVAQLPNDGRVAEAPDRPSHSYTSTQDSDPYEVTENSITKIMLCGLTDRSAAELVPLAKSWQQAPKIDLASKTFIDRGYDPTERAYILGCKADGNPSRLEFELSASEDSPLINPAFVIMSWGEAGAKLKINGKQIEHGKNFRFGHYRRLQGTDLIVWLKIETTTPIRTTLSPAAD